MDAPLRRRPVKRGAPLSARSASSPPDRFADPPAALAADRLLRLAAKGAPGLIALLVGLPVAAGLLFTLLPAFGYLPALGGAELSLDPFRRLLAQPGIWRSAALSLWSGLLASLVSLGLAFLILAALAGTPLFARLRLALPPLLALPHAAAAFGLAFLVAPSGLVARLVSPELTGWTTPPDILVVNDPAGLALSFGLAAKEVPFLLLVALAAWPQAEPERRLMLARSLGYGRVAGFLFAVWPALYPQMRLAVFAVVAFSTAVADVAVILGPTLPPPLVLRLLSWMNDPDLSRRFLACAGALFQLGVTLLALALWIAGERLFAALRDALALRGRRLGRDGFLRAFAGVAAALAAGSLVAGVVSLLLWSFSGPLPFPDAWPRAFTLQTWARVLPGLAGPLADTLLIASASSTIALVLCVLALHGGSLNRRSNWLYLPLLVPQASFLFGLQLLFLLLGLGSGRAALVLAHLVFVLPYVALALSGPWNGFDRRFEAVAASLGAGEARTLFRVRLPALLPALLGSLAIGFVVSAGLYLPTVLVGAGRVVSVTTEAVALAAGADRRAVGALAFVQMLVPAAAFAIALLLPPLLRRLRHG